MKKISIGQEIRIKCVEDSHESLGSCCECILAPGLCGFICGYPNCPDGKSTHFEFVTE